IGAAVLHDVDLAALRPADISVVCAKEPERGPHSLPVRDLDDRLEATILLREEPVRLDPTRRVRRPLIALLYRGDNEVAARNADILGAARVVVLLAGAEVVSRVV